VDHAIIETRWRSLHFLYTANSLDRSDAITEPEAANGTLRVLEAGPVPSRSYVLRGFLHYWSVTGILILWLSAPA